MCQHHVRPLQLCFSLSPFPSLSLHLYIISPQFLFPRYNCSTILFLSHLFFSLSPLSLYPPSKFTDLYCRFPLTLFCPDAVGAMRSILPGSCVRVLLFVVAVLASAKTKKKSHQDSNCQETVCCNVLMVRTSQRTWSSCFRVSMHFLWYV